MGTEWKALAFSDVSESSLKAAFVELGLDWGGCLHVAATGSLARAMRASGAPAVSIANLLDVIAWSGMDSELSMPISQFPSLAGIAAGPSGQFDRDLKIWANDLAGRNLRLAVIADQRLRRFLDSDAPNIPASGVLRRQVRELRKAVQVMASAGYVPSDFDDVEPIPRVALSAWKRLSEEVPELFRLATDVWIDLREFRERSTPHAVKLRERIEETVRHLIGSGTQVRSIVYHGFYFFTPHQWAFFQLLREHDEIDQYFIVHDDGQGRAFESWRHYFTERLDMPIPQFMGGRPRITRAELLRKALDGEAVPPAVSDQPIRLVECRTSTEFVDFLHWQRSSASHDGRKGPALFAAGAGEIERLVNRLDFDPDGGDVNLAELPIGQFLLALHGCIESRPGGGRRLLLDRSRLVDMVASKLLDTGDRDPSRHIGAFRRSMPFFDDCLLLSEWIERSEVLERLVISEVSPLGGRDSRLTDRERIAVSVANPLRLIPWADLSELEAGVIRETIARVASMIERVTLDAERKSPDKYLGWIRQQLAQGMAHLPPEDRDLIDAKLRGFSSVSDGDLDVEGIIEVVQIILGRHSDFGLDGDSEPETSSAREMRNLDALGYTKSTVDVHVANLVDTEFPMRHQSFRWPFSQHLLKSVPNHSFAGTEILRTREATASLSDLYLFWLALDGVDPSATLTLSWITEFGTDLRNPSSLLMLIATLDHRSPSLTEAIGGVCIERAGNLVHLEADREIPALDGEPTSDTELDQSIAQFDAIALASAFICPRRFAIQWAMGPSGAFQSPHSQRLLFGNLQDALQEIPGVKMSESRARRVVKDLWRQFTRGERMSSYVKRVVKVRQRSARWQWIYTLKGRNNGTDPFDEAYSASKAGRRPSRDIVAPDGSDAAVLPRLNWESERLSDCVACPVRPRCAVQASL